MGCDWRYNIKTGYQQLQEDPLAWKGEEDFLVALQRNGYRTGSPLSGGDTLSCSFSYSVYTKESTEQGYPFFVVVDINSSCYHVFVDDFPSVIDLLTKLAPIAREASEKVRDELAEDEKKEQAMRRGARG